MDVSSVLVGINPGDRINQGQFLRLTFGRTRRLGLPIELFSFQHDIQALFDKLDAADGLAQPVSNLDVAPGQEAAVIDVLVRPAAVGVDASYLANYFDGLRFGVSLTSMTPVDTNAVLSGADDRGTLQTQLDSAEKSKDPLAVFGQYAKMLEWALVALLLVALLYYGGKAWKLARVAL